MNYRVFELKPGQQLGRQLCSQVYHQHSRYSLWPGTIDLSIQILTVITGDCNKNAFDKTARWSRGMILVLAMGLQIYFDIHLLVQRRTTFIILDNLQNVGAILTSKYKDNDSNVIHLK